jgi:TRAP-type C4-dicarboxylate transport system substrate-binding protein
MLNFRIAIVASSLIVAGAAPSAAQDYPELRLRYATHVPEDNIVSESDKFFARKVEELSGGDIKVDVYWNRAIGKQQEMLPMISAGAVDFTTLETAQYGETPLMGFMNTIYPVHRDAAKLVEMSNWLYQNSAGIRGELERIGARPLFVRHLPSYHLLCSKPFRTINDFKGAKLRAFGAYVPLMWQSLGATAVNVVTTEMYDGLDKGVFDCTFLPAPFLHNLKLYEVAKYLIDIEFGMIEFAPTLVPTVNWDSWPENVQELLTAVAEETEQFALQHTQAKSGASVQALLDEGVELVEFPEAEKLLANLPDLMAAWEERQASEGRGEAAKEIVSYARQALGVPAR